MLVVGINLVSKLYLIYSKLPSHIDYTFLIFPIIIIIGVYVYSSRLVSSKPRLILMGALFLMVFLITSPIIENNREEWLPVYHNVIMELYDHEPTNIFIASGTSFTGYKYPFYGNEFQHSFSVGNDDELIQIIQSNHTENPTYVIKQCVQHIDCKEGLQKFGSTMTNFGYKIKATDRNAILLEFNK